MAKAKKQEQSVSNDNITLGQVGYDAYSAATGGKSLISGDPLPPFSGLKQEIQDAWQAAGKAVAAAVGRSTPSEGHYATQNKNKEE